MRRVLRASRTRLALWGGLVTVAALVVVAGGCPGRRPGAPQRPAGSPAPEAVALGVALRPSSALVFIAQQQGYFTQAGLTATIKEYPSGKRAIEGMLAGEVNVSTGADVPFVVSSFARSDLRLLATISAADDDPRIVARKDRGIRQPADLRGKRVATRKGSSVHFFLHHFLRRYGLTERDVKLSFMKDEELTPALAAGQIDAFSAREPQTSQARRALGDRAVFFAGPGLYRCTENLVSLSSFLQARPQVAPKLLTALLQAEDLAAREPQQASQIIAGRVGITAPEAAAEIAGLDLRVRLDQSLLQTLEDIARWAMREQLTAPGPMPNYLPLLYLEGLAATRPEAITIIH